MRMIGYLVDYANILKNQVGCSTSRAIVPECMTLEENAKNNDTKEDKVDEKKDAWRMVRNNKHDRNEVANGRSTHGVMESDAEECGECEEDDRDWQENLLEL